MTTYNNTNLKRFGIAFIILGLICLLAAMGFAAYNFFDEKRANESVSSVLPQIIEKQDKTVLKRDPDEKPAYELSKDIMMPVIEIDGYLYCGTIDIPQLDISLPVLDSLTPALLKVSPCRWKGSAYQDDLIIAAHNYRSHFGYLKNLAVGDTVIFTDMDGNKFTYEIKAIELIPPTGINEMQSGGWPLTLFTCTIGGGARVTVRCDIVK